MCRATWRPWCREDWPGWLPGWLRGWLHDSLAGLSVTSQYRAPVGAGCLAVARCLAQCVAQWQMFWLRCWYGTRCVVVHGMHTGWWGGMRCACSV